MAETHPEFIPAAERCKQLLANASNAGKPATNSSKPSDSVKPAAVDVKTEVPPAKPSPKRKKKA